MFKLIILLILAATVVDSRQISYTIAGVTCMSTCKLFENYHFCWVGWDKEQWDYCTITGKTGPDFLSRSNPPKICLSDCTNAGYKYHWCFTNEDANQWDRCDPTQHETQQKSYNQTEWWWEILKIFNNVVKRS